MCVIYVINVSVRANYFFRVVYVGPGARLAVSLEGRGARLWRLWLYIKWSLSLKHVVLEGVM